MIDEATHHVPASMATAAAGGAAANRSFSLARNGADAQAFWNGPIQVLGDNDNDNALGWNGNINSNSAHPPSDSSRTTPPFWKAASNMAYSSHSRYHGAGQNDSPGHRYSTNPNNSRHVVWDDDDEEEDEEDPFIVFGVNNKTNGAGKHKPRWPSDKNSTSSWRKNSDTNQQQQAHHRSNPINPRRRPRRDSI